MDLTVNIRMEGLIRKGILNVAKRIVRHFLISERRAKEDWEFQWQCHEWCELFSQPETKAKVLEYWNNFRYLREIRKHIPFDETTITLDVGCGISTVLHYLTGKRYGIDPLADRYKSIYLYPDDIYIQTAYGESIPFSNNFFNVVICSNCIDHTDHPQRTLTEIRRVLKPGGYFILTCEVFPADLGKRNVGHPHSMTLTNLMTLVEGFSIVERWESPWVGLRGYVLGNPPTEQLEQIFLLRKFKPGVIS